MKYLSQEEYEAYRKSLPGQGFSNLETKIIIAELCECGRLYKDRRDESGKMMCSACLLGCSVEDLERLWTIKE